MSKKIKNPNAVKPRLIQIEELNKFMAMSVQQSSEGMAYADLDGKIKYFSCLTRYDQSLGKRMRESHANFEKVL